MAGTDVKGRSASRGRRDAADPVARWLGVACVAVPVAVLLLATLVFGLHPARALRDPAAYVDFPFYVGMFSHIGALGWWTAAAAGLLAAFTLRAASEERRMMLWGGLLSAMLAIDDLFMVHDNVMPAYLGVPELPVLAAIGLSGVAYVWRFRALHVQVAPVLLVVCLVLFASGLVVDLARGSAQDEQGLGILFEDGFKLAGIGGWAAYHLLVARAFLRQRMPPQGGGAG
jgi:hypothetical protein